jgi:hypothetical protein
MKKIVIKIITIITASLFALLLMSFILGWANKHFGQLSLEDEEYCIQNTCFKIGTKGGYAVVFKSEDGKKWEETFPNGKIYMYPQLVETVYYSVEISGNTVWVTEVAPAPGESDGEIVGIYYSQNLGVIWNKIPDELSRHYSMLTFDEKGNGKLITRDWNSANGEIIEYIRHYNKELESKEWILTNEIIRKF